MEGDTAQIGKTCITISGPPGSGTSTAAALLAARLGIEHVDSGTFFRQIARERGLSLRELGRRAEQDSRIDREVDRRTVDLANAGKEVVLEGRMAGWMLHRAGVPSLKVWLDAHEEVRACRIAGREDRPFGHVLREMVERERSERRRYGEIYGIEIRDLSPYDVVLETDNLSPTDVMERIAEALTQDVPRIPKEIVTDRRGAR